jgi:hypothetical protein
VRAAKVPPGIRPGRHFARTRCPDREELGVG